MKKVTIQVPEPVALLGLNGTPLLDADGNQVIITFGAFIKGTLLVDAKFGRSMAEILSAVEIKNRVEKLEVGQDQLELDQDDWERLKKVVEEPSVGYNPAVVMQIAEFLTAIRDAK